MRIFQSALLLSAALSLAVAPACDSGTSTPLPQNDTTQGSDTTTPLDTSGGGSDAIADVLPDIPSTPGTVKALQGEAEATGCNETGIITVNPQVSLTAVVVTSPKFDAFTPSGDSNSTALDGYYVADQDGGSWSGIAIAIARDENTDFIPGDVLDIDGSLEEFYCFTQVKATSVLKGSTVAAPEPLTVMPDDIGKEEYEGMLVKIEDISVTEEVGGGVYRVTGGFLVDHEFSFFLSMNVGDDYDIIGEVKFAYNEWRVMPRTSADVIRKSAGTASTIKDIQGSDASINCSGGAVSDPPITSDLDIVGVITSPRIDVSSNLHGYYISDGTTDDYSAMKFTIGKSAETDFQVGDVVALNGNHKEWFCNTQFQALQATIDASTTLSVPAPRAITAGMSDADLEKVEGMLVEIENVTVTDTSSEYADYTTDAGLLVDDELLGADFSKPATGTVFSKITGFVGWAHSKWRIHPRTTADLVTSGD